MWIDVVTILLALLAIFFLMKKKNGIRPDGPGQLEIKVRVESDEKYTD